MTGSLRHRLALIAPLAIVLAVGFPPSAHAYLDPASGSMILQVLLGGLAGAAVAIRLLWRRIAGAFQRRKGDEPQG